MKRNLSASLNVVLGVLLMVGPWYLFKACGTETKVMKCFWSCKAELALGALFIVLGLLSFTMKEGESLKLSCLMSVAMSVAAICIPAFIMEGCMKPSMECRTTAFPTIYFLSGANALAQLGILALSRRSKQSDK